ncbi:MAG: hypothetical protein KIG52_09660, partial [Muribaculaceae bacterium]|nr:hypothetical protein [Muribaculaceae bacterium]
MNIEAIVNVVFAVSALFALAVMLKHDMQMMQQNSYRNERYIKWFKQNNESTSMQRLIALFATIVSATSMCENSWYVIIIISSLLVWTGVSELRKKFKKPLVFTKRVQRLYFTELTLILLVTAAVAVWKQNVYTAGFVMALATAVSGFITMAVNWLMKPVENHINQGFINDAKRRLAGMQDMIIVGITGSYGKTSTKHYLNRILSEKYSVLM